MSHLGARLPAFHQSHPQRKNPAKFWFGTTSLCQHNRFHGSWQRPGTGNGNEYYCPFRMDRRQNWMRMDMSACTTNYLFHIISTLCVGEGIYKKSFLEGGGSEGTSSHVGKSLEAMKNDKEELFDTTLDNL